MSTDRFAETVADMRDLAERQHRRGLVLAALDNEDKPPTPAALDKAMSAWTPPPDDVLEEQAAKFIAAAAEQAAYVAERAGAAVDAAVTKREKADATARDAREAETAARDALASAADEAERARQAHGYLPDHLKILAPFADSSQARAETATGSGGAGEN